MGCGRHRLRRRSAATLLATLVVGIAACSGDGGGDLRDRVDGSATTSTSTGPGGGDGTAPTPTSASPATADVEVPATANIFGAGHAASPAPGGGDPGTLPLEVRVDDREILEFPSVTGLAHCCGEAPSTGPDGYPGVTAIPGVGGIAGFVDRERQLALLGVFLGPDEPAADEPRGLDFTGNHDFASLAPGLAQPFFIGDGRTGAGALQQFEVPEGATRLFLGIADAFNFEGPTGHYGDDQGSFVVHLRSIPEVGGLLLNGGFESFVVDVASEPRCDGSTGVTGWDVGSGCVDQVSTALPAHGGQQCIALGGEPPGTLSQTVATEVGTSYTLTYYVGADPEGPPTATGSIEVTGAPPTTLTAAPGAGDPGWTYGEVTFVASSEETTITFAGDVLVDDTGLATTR